MPIVVELDDDVRNSVNSRLQVRQLTCYAGVDEEYCLVFATALGRSKIHKKQCCAFTEKPERWLARTSGLNTMSKRFLRRMFEDDFDFVTRRCPTSSWNHDEDQA